jgi:hypothetical protein
MLLIPGGQPSQGILEVPVHRQHEELIPIVDEIDR